MSGLAPRLSVAQVTKTAREYPWDYDLSPAGQAARAAAETETDEVLEADDAEPRTVPTPPAPADVAWYGWDDNGRFRMFANLGADTGTIVENAMKNAYDTLFNAGVPDVNTTDALVEMAERSLDTIESPERRSRYRINFHINERGHVSDSRGRPVNTSAADRVTCNTLVSPVEFVNGVPVSVGRSQHIVPDRTRRLIEHRDEGCRVPGCSSDRYLEVHHIIHWTNHGPTDTYNLICLCPKHHRLHHQGQLAITGNADLPDGTTGCAVFTDRYGKQMTQSGARPWPPRAEPPPIAGTYEHPYGERLDFRWLYFNDDPNRPAPCGSLHPSQLTDTRTSDSSTMGAA